MTPRRHPLYISDKGGLRLRALGHFFSSAEEIVPDIIATAKGLASGYQPFGAVLLAKGIVGAMAAAAVACGILSPGVTGDPPRMPTNGDQPIHQPQ